MGVKSSYAFPIRPILLSWILVLASLSLILKSGLYSDDLITFQTRHSGPPLTFVQLAHSTQSHITDWAHSGRFTPITYMLQDFLFWIVNTILLYKVTILCMNLCAVFSFTQMLRSFEMHGWTPLALILFCATAQFYVRYHDPFTSLHAMYPLLAIFIFFAISFFVRYLKGEKTIWLACSVSATILAILLSEIGFILYPIFLILLINDAKPISKKLVAFFPFLILLIIDASILIVLRRHISHVYSGVQASLDPAKMFKVAFFQIVAAIPLTGYSYMSNIGSLLLEEFLKVYQLLILGVILIVYLIKSSDLSQYQRLDTQKRRNVIGVGIVLFVLPACILMFSKKYQAELDYGRGYLPVYIQDFGFVLLMLALFDFLFEKFQNTQKTILTIGLLLAFLISQLTFFRNDFLIGQMNSEHSTPSAFYYKSLKNGILNKCEIGSVIVFGTNYFYPDPAYYQTIVDNFYNTHLQVILKEDSDGISMDKTRPYYLLEHDNTGQFTTLYRISPNEKKLIRRINYPIGDEFSYFDLISKPL